MDKKGCSCSVKNSEVTCRGCDLAELPYWCETCKKLVAEKRCPGCGLKCRKARQPA